MKSLKVSEEVWKHLMRLKIDWGLKDVDEVIRELLRRAGFGSA